jgi:hypothetical protein
MNRPDLDSDLAAALELLERVFGPDPDLPRVLSVRPNLPRRRPAPPLAPAAAGPEQPRLLELPSVPPPTPNRRTV